MKIKLFIFLVVSLIPSKIILANETDSLFNLLSRAKTSEKPTILNKIAQSYIPGYPEKGLSYALQAIEQSKMNGSKIQEALGNKIAGAAWYNMFQYEKAMKAYEQSLSIYSKLKDFNQIASIYLNIGLIYRDQSLFNESQKIFEKSLALYDSIGNKNGIANACNHLGGLSWKRGNHHNALKYYNQLLQIRLQLKNAVDIANAYNRIGFVYKEKGMFDKAIEQYTQAQEYYLTTQNFKLIASNLNDLGNVYLKKGIYEKALEYYFKAVKLRYKTDDKAEIANSYINIGSIYYTLENYQKAKEYYNQALTLYSEALQKRKIANTLTLIGNTESIIGNKQEALDLYVRALSLRKKIGDKTDIAQSLNSIGTILSEMGQTSKALSQFNEAIKIRTELKDTIGIIITYNEIGNLYEKIQSPQQSSAYFNKALVLAKAALNKYHISLCSRKLAEIAINQNIGTQQLYVYLKDALTYGEQLQHPELIKNAQYAYYLFYLKSKNFEKALYSYKISSKINDSLQDLRNNSRITSIQQNIEIEKKNNELNAYENEVKLLRQEKEIQNIQISKQTHFRNGLLIISVLIILVAILFIRLYYLKRKNNQKLEEQYRLLQTINNQLIERENQLKILNSTKDKYFSIIAHDIKNPLSALMNLSHIIIEKFDALTDDKIQEFNKMIHESANNLHTLLENLLYWARANTNKIKYQPENIHLKTVIHNIFLINKLSANQKNITLKDKAENFEVYADLQMLTSIMRNLVSNAIKFTPEGGTIEITTQNQGRMIEISVTDTGVGMNSEDLEKLFRLDTHFTGRGTNNEAGTGLGLILVKEFVEKNQGKISVWSEPGNGSTFTFSIPNATW